MVVYDDNVSRVAPARNACNEARLEIRAFLADARVALGVDAAPEREISGRSTSSAVAGACIALHAETRSKWPSWSGRPE